MTKRISSLPVLPRNRRDLSWRASAACLAVNPELFFPVGFTGPGAVAGIRAAKSICHRCPVQDRCLSYAVETGQAAGIWGGYDENERRLLRQRQRPDASTTEAAVGRRP